MYSQRAMVLHLVPYRESSVIVRFLTESAGKISGIYRGVRGNKRKSKTVVQPLYSGVVEYLGKPDLFTISNFEANRYPALTCLLYTSPSPRDEEESRMPSSP